jgi:hypothetical protein
MPSDPHRTQAHGETAREPVCSIHEVVITVCYGSDRELLSVLLTGTDERGQWEFRALADPPDVDIRKATDHLVTLLDKVGV